MEEEITTESIADALTASFEEASQAESEPETETAEEVAVSEGAAEEVEETEVEATEEASEESEEPETVFQAPEHWSSDDREAFEARSPEAQKLILKLEKDFKQGYQERVEGISAITEALEPWKDELAQRGVTADQAIRTLFAAQHSLDTNPVQGVLQIAQSYGILDQLRKEFSPETDDNDFTDPEIKALRAEVSDLKNQQNQNTQAAQDERNRAVQAQIDNFANAKDSDGNLSHPHFEQVRVQMGPLVDKGMSMEEAYKEAVWTVPEYRESQLKAQEKAKAEKTEAEKAQKVKQAKKAARGVKTNGKADPAEGADALSLGDELREAFRQHSA